MNNTTDKTQNLSGSVFHTVSYNVLTYAYKRLYAARRGCYYAGKIGYSHPIQDVSRGHMPYTAGRVTGRLYPDVIYSEYDKIKELLETEKVLALSDVKDTTDNLLLHHQDCSLLYLKAGNEIVGCGYYSEHENQDMMDIMVAFIMYDIANYSMDETFMKAVNHYIVSQYGENILTEFDYILRKTEH